MYQNYIFSKYTSLIKNQTLSRIILVSPLQLQNLYYCKGINYNFWDNYTKKYKK